MRANTTKARARHIPVKDLNFFCKKQFIVFFKFPEDHLSRATNLYIILLSMLTTEIVLWKQSERLYWLQDTYITTKPFAEGILH